MFYLYFADKSYNIKMKNIFFLILGLIIILGSLFLFIQRQKNIDNSFKTLKINGQEIMVEIARTPDALRKGLSGRESLTGGMGMLFVYDDSGVYGFWMKDMNFALDIVWIDEDFRVIGIEREVQPETFPETFYPPKPVKYVLELNAGESKNMGIETGLDMIEF